MPHKGKDNTVADFLSRMHCLEPNPVNDVPTSIAMVVSIPDVPQPPEYYLEQVYGGRALHVGFKRTWEALNKFFPGHTITQQCVRDFVKACPIYQKDRLGMTSGINQSSATSVLHIIEPVLASIVLPSPRLTKPATPTALLFLISSPSTPPCTRPHRRTDAVHLFLHLRFVRRHHS